jgi:hypothetical protein
VALDSETLPFDAPPPLPRVVFPSAVDRRVPPEDRDLARLWRVLGVLVVTACCGLILWVLDPRFLLRNTTPNGGDLGAHVWFPAYLRDHLLPDFRVAGWSNDWFGGFPAGQFYFPLPAVVTVVLDLFMPYNIALKLTTAIGPVAMPAGAYAFGRGLRLRRPGPELCAIATVCFLFFKGVSAASGSAMVNVQFNQRIMGGTLVSALAGEYSFSFALALGLFALGALAYSVRTGRRGWLAALLIAATVLSHVVVGMFVGVGAIVILIVALTSRRPPRRWTLARATAIGAVAALLTAFWSLPLVATFGYTANMRYTKITHYLDYLNPDEFLWVYLLALVGLAFAIAFRERAALTIAALTLTFAAVFRFWPELHAWNLRFLPFFYLGMFLMAAVGAAEIIRRLSSEFGRLWVGAAPMPDEAYEFSSASAGRTYRVVTNATIAVVVTVVVTTGLVFSFSHRGFIPYWTAWNETGYENAARPHKNPATEKANARKQYGEYHALITTVDRLPPGRLLWEGGGTIDNYGTPLALMLLPYWTHGRIQSFEGLYYESAASTPYVFMTIASLSGSGNSSDPVRGLDYHHIEAFKDGVRELRALGGRYYAAHSADATKAADADPNLRRVARVKDFDGQAPEGWTIYEVRDHALVAPLTYEPLVVGERAARQAECFGRPPAGDPGPELEPWECVAAGWWANPANLDRPLAASGPASWLHARPQDARGVPRRRLPAVTVGGIHETENSIRFRVSRPGVPVVVRTSYFPNWKATGAAGPWRLTPNLMVVVPTGRSVELHFDRSSSEKLGGLLSLGGLIGLGGLVGWDVRRRRRSRPGRPLDTPESGRVGGLDHMPAGPGTTRGAGGSGATMTVPS